MSGDQSTQSRGRGRGRGRDDASLPSNLRGRGVGRGEGNGPGRTHGQPGQSPNRGDHYHSRPFQVGHRENRARGGDGFMRGRGGAIRPEVTLFSYGAPHLLS